MTQTQEKEEINNHKKRIKILFFFLEWVRMNYVRKWALQIKFIYISWTEFVKFHKASVMRMFRDDDTYL